MCGIVGVLKGDIQGSISQIDAEKIFTDLVYADAVRGWDATGVAFAGKADRQQVDIYKRALEAGDFLSQRKYQSLLRKSAGVRFFLGHNRAATQGAITDEMSHPFEFEHIVGVHNGTLFRHSQISPDGFSSNSDSETIFAAFNECPPGEPDEVVKKLDGSFSLVWYDKRDGNLYAIRNKERPMAILPIEGKCSVILSSEAPMGRWVALRHGHKIAKEAGYSSEGHLYCFDRDKPNEFTSRQLELKPAYKAPAWNNDYYYNRHNNGGRYQGGNNSHSSSSSGSSKGKKVQSIPAGGDTTIDVGDELEFVVVSSIAKGTGRLIDGYLIEEPFTQTCCFIKHSNLHVDPSKIKRNDNILGKIKKIKENDLLGYIVHMEFVEMVVEEGEEEEMDPEGIDINDDASGKSIIELYHGPGNKMIPLAEFNKVTKGGCVKCTTNIYAEHSKDLAWTSDGRPWCEKCMKEEGIKPGQVVN